MDAYSNPVADGGARVVISFEEDDSVSATVTDKKNGQYVIKLETRVSGLHRMTVLVNDVQCDGCPYQINVLSSAAHAPACIASGMHRSASCLSTPTASPQSASDACIHGCHESIHITIEQCSYQMYIVQ